MTRYITTCSLSVSLSIKSIQHSQEYLSCWQEAQDFLFKSQMNPGKECMILHITRYRIWTDLMLALWAFYHILWNSKEKTDFCIKKNNTVMGFQRVKVCWSSSFQRSHFFGYSYGCVNASKCLFYRVVQSPFFFFFFCTFIRTYLPCNVNSRSIIFNPGFDQT